MSTPLVAVVFVQVSNALNGTNSFVIHSFVVVALLVVAIVLPSESRSSIGNVPSKYHIPRASPEMVSGLFMRVFGIGEVTMIIDSVEEEVGANGIGLSFDEVVAIIPILGSTIDVFGCVVMVYV